jgi:hypothetical protein
VANDVCFAAWEREPFFLWFVRCLITTIVRLSRRGGGFIWSERSYCTHRPYLLSSPRARGHGQPGLLLGKGHKWRPPSTLIGSRLRCFGPIDLWCTTWVAERVLSRCTAKQCGAQTRRAAFAAAATAASRGGRLRTRLRARNGARLTSGRGC